MSLKPPKKSDLGKSWMKPRRDKNILIRPEYHLIVTEGTTVFRSNQGYHKQSVSR